MSLPAPTLATATDLVAWADRLDARGGLPRLVRRLVLGSQPNARPVGFRAEEGVDLPGWDGVTHGEQGDPFVPPGAAGWELTVRADTKQKADQGYRDRLRNAAPLVPADSTFVFVTLRRWRDKDKWTAERRKEGQWRDLRVLDADDLETWLEAKRAVHQWFSRTIGRQPPGCDDLESFWGGWAGATSPTLLPNLLLAGREAVVDDVATWYTSDDATLHIQAESPEDAAALFAATVMSLPQPLRDGCIARTVVVRTPQACEELCSVSDSIVIVPRFDDPETLAKARRLGHRTVTALPPGLHAPPASGKVVEVKKLSSQVARDRFRELGFDQESASRLATLARRSLPALRRKLSHDPVPMPTWASSDPPSSLLAIMLAGAWRDTESDTAILARLAQVTPDEIGRVALRHSQGADPLVRKSGSSWYLASREDSWRFLGPQITQADLDRFVAVVPDVLGEVDPRSDLPQDRRWTALEMRAHSANLRRGLAESLALMGSRGADQSVNPKNLSSRVADTVSDLLARANANCRHWLSLAPFLPLLAEAAPDVFLDAVEAGLTGSKPVMGLFVPDHDPLFRSPDHTHLLWALETLAWNPDLLGRVARALSHLAELDPGGKILNRPRKSLRDIFLIWLPGTNAPWERRYSVLQGILDAVPPVGWRLCCDILPHAHDMTGRLPRPVWREWGHAEPVCPTAAAQRAAVAELVSLMLQEANATSGRWPALTRALPNLPSEQFGQVVRALEELNVDALCEEDRNGVYEATRVTVARHRRFPSADWALPREAVDRLCLLESRYAPSDPISRSAWLFDAAAELSDRGQADADEQGTPGIAGRRRGAVEEAYRRNGRRALEMLLDRARSAWTLGVAVGESEIADEDVRPLVHEWLAHSDPRRAEVARSFVGGRSVRRGRQWGEDMFGDSRLSDAQKAQVLAGMPNDRQTWQLAESNPEVAREYWRHMLPYAAREGADVEYVARRLLEHGRSFSAAELLFARLEEDPSLDPGLVVDVLEAGLREGGEDAGGSIEYEIGKLLDYLVAVESVDDARLTRLEFGYAAFLRFVRPPTSFHRALAGDPEVFVWLVTLIYGRAGQESGEPTELERNRAELAFQVMDSWSTLPALSADGTVNATGLCAWVDGALAGTSAKGLGDLGAELVGEVLSRSPTGADGIWPHEAVREQIERLRDDRVARGFRHGVYNGRGIVTKNPFEGGKQEHELAGRYGAWAGAIGDRWPAVGAVLRQIGEDYRGDAAREDGESDRRGDGMV